jgi:hypothetical protein
VKWANPDALNGAWRSFGVEGGCKDVIRDPFAQSRFQRSVLAPFALYCFNSSPHLRTARAWTLSPRSRYAPRPCTASVVG